CDIHLSDFLNKFHSSLEYEHVHQKYMFSLLFYRYLLRIFSIYTPSIVSLKISIRIKYKRIELENFYTTSEYHYFFIEFIFFFLSIRKILLYYYYYYKKHP